MPAVYPLTFEPIFKRRIWGGHNLQRLLDKNLPAGTRIGESWELVDLPSDESIVAGGPDKGASIRQLIQLWGRDLLGPADLCQGRFPLLVKFLDAEAVLSVQVHPDRQAAAQLGPDVQPKYEAWYVLEARCGSAIYCGVKPGVTARTLLAASRDGTVGDLLNRYEARAGDCFYLPGGSVHAMGPGLVIAEPQTPSDVTYRLFDWNRVDPETGKPRQLHLEQAIRVARFQYRNEDFRRRPEAISGFGDARAARLVACEAFVMDRFQLAAGARMPTAGGEMAVWMMLSGQGRLSGGSYDVPVRRGDTLLLPAALARGTFRPDRDCTWLRITVPR
jgi:mannose-6-phosphate isomerase